MAIVLGRSPKQWITEIEGVGVFGRAADLAENPERAAALALLRERPTNGMIEFETPVQSAIPAARKEPGALVRAFLNFFPASRPRESTIVDEALPIVRAVNHITREL